jgi:MFS family permease
MTQALTTIPKGETPRGVLAGVLGSLQILSWGSTFYLLPVLAKPITADTGWPYDWVMGGVALGLLVAGLVSPRVGRTIARISGRIVLAGGSILIAVGLAMMALSTNVAVYLCGWAVMGMGMGAGLYDAAFSTLGALYGKDARSAITTVTLFGGFASTVCWPFSAWLVEHVGWRGACWTYAALHLCVGATLYLLVVPGRVSATLAKAGDAKTSSVRLLPAERLVFAVLAAAFTIGAAILSLMGTQMITLLLGSGLELAEAVGLGMLIGPSAVGARLIEALAGSRYHPIWTLVASVTLVGCGAVLFFVGPAVFAFAIASYAAGNGIASIAKGTLPLALFGAPRYPGLMGRLGLPVLFAMSLAPYVGALIFEIGGVRATLKLFAVLAGTNILLVTTLFLLTRQQRNSER